MFKRGKQGGKPENRRQYVLSAVRNVMMLFANDAPPTFLSVFGLAFQTFEAVVLTICAHITKREYLNRTGQANLDQVNSEQVRINLKEHNE